MISRYQINGGESGHVLFSFCHREANRKHYWDSEVSYKVKNKTLLVETCQKSQTESLLKVSTFFGSRVSISEHQSLNSSKGIVRDRMLKGEKEEEILDYLRELGVTACKRFKIKKDHETVVTNTLLLTFNTVNMLKSLYHVVLVDIYLPNPLGCFNC